MSDVEFRVIAMRLVWGESEEEPTPQGTIKRLKTLTEERDLFLWALKDLSEALLVNAAWTEREVSLAKALLWGLQTLYEQQELTFRRSLQPTKPPSAVQTSR